MKNRKSVLLLLIIFILTAASLYLVYIIQDGSSPLALFNTRAADEAALDDELNNLLAKVDGSPTIPYKSTSPSPTLPPGGATSPQITTTPSGTLLTPTTTSPTITKTPGVSVTSSPTGNVVYVTATPTQTVSYVTPTPITTLPVAGFADELPKYVLGGGLLVILGMFL